MAAARRYRCCVRRPEECLTTTIASGDDAPIGWRNVVVGSRDLWFCPSHDDVAEYAEQLEKQLVARQTTFDEFLGRAAQTGLADPARTPLLARIVNPLVAMSRDIRAATGARLPEIEVTLTHEVYKDLCLELSGTAAYALLPRGDEDVIRVAGRISIRPERG